MNEQQYQRDVLMGSEPKYRYLVYRTRESREWLCVALARDAKDAIKVARQLFRLSRAAWARRES